MSFGIPVRNGLGVGLLASTSLATRRGGVSFSPLSLFTSGEQGFIYDPSDLSTMFQDTAGTTPVTAVGQTVGLVLDKSRGLVLGPELVTNGDFSNGSTGWTLGSGWSVSGGQLVGTSVPLGVSARNATNVTTGAIVCVTYTVTIMAGSVYVRIRNTNGVTRSASGTYTEYLVVGSGTQFIDMVAGSVFTGTIDNISVRELPGNHATQSVLASRPILAREPLGGRRNLLSQTEDLAISPWTTAVSGVAAPVRTANSAVAPNDTTTATKIDFPAVSASQFSVVTQLVGTGLASVARIGSAWVKASSPADIGKTLFVYGPAQSGQVAIVLTGDWQRITTLVMPANTTASLIFGTLGSAISGGLDQSAFSFLVWGAQLETGSTATAYQRVTSTYDVTEAGKADLYYLLFDGSDDFLVTNTITPGTDKAQVFAGLRKLSDANGIVAEMSVSSPANNGSFNMQTGRGTGQSAVISSKGTISVDAFITQGSSPITSVLTGLMDIPAPLIQPRNNGISGTPTTTSQGTGNYLAYPAYIGRRGGTALPFNGRIYSLIVRFGANLSDVQIAQTEQWMNSKTGAY